jgi:quinoprotein glucose dehydrogenase
MPGNNGGVNWGSSAVDPVKGTMYIVSKELPMGLKLELPRPPGAGRGGRGGRGGPEAADAAPEAALPPVPPSALPPVPAPKSPGGSAPGSASDFIHYNAPYDFMQSMSNRLSAIGPPWSQLTAYDLNTGTIKSRIPNGGVSALEEQGHAGSDHATGAHFPRGGVVATAGGLLFVATASDRKIRAYDEDTGKVLWEKGTPAGSGGLRSGRA